MEKNEGIMSVFNRYNLRTTFAIARNAKESKLDIAIGHLLLVCLNYCYSTVLVVIHFHNLAYFEGWLLVTKGQENRMAS